MAHYDQLKEGAPIFDKNGYVKGFEEELEWNEKDRRFVLTTDAVKNELGVDLAQVRGDANNARIFLDEISNLVYTYLYKKKTGRRRPKMEYYLTFDMRNRRALYYAMLDMLRYAFYSGGNIAGYQIGVNFNESALMDIHELRDERIVAYATDSILKTNMLIDRDFVERFTVPDNVEWS